MRSITVITGTRDAGKTSVVREAAALIPDAIGVIAEKCFDAEGNVDGYDAVIVPTGRRLPLCRRRSAAPFTVRHGGFWFDDSVFDYVDSYIRENFDGTRTVIIDEIGSLEVKHHSGYYPLLLFLMEQPSLSLIITLRG